jgi:hypothetical protein
MVEAEFLGAAHEAPGVGIRGDGDAEFHGLCNFNTPRQSGQL